jgi:hypothetical protein
MKSPTSRTTLITIAAVVGVLTAGTAAIAANIGILNATTGGPIGALSATDELVQTTPPEANIQAMVEVPATTATTEPAPTTTEAPGSSYVVDEAGSVTVMATPDGVVLLNMVANPGWTVVPAQTDPMALTVTFDNGSRTVVFTASLGADGEIVADVTEPVVVVAPQPQPSKTSSATQSATTGSSSYHDDDHDDDHSDDHETHSYEGGGDDD